jgi:hypothetical protein
MLCKGFLYPFFEAEVYIWYRIGIEEVYKGYTKYIPCIEEISRKYTLCDRIKWMFMLLSGVSEQTFFMAHCFKSKLK